MTSLCGCKNEQQDLPKVGIIQYMDHTSLNTIHDEIINEFKNKGYENEKNIMIYDQNAGGDQSILRSICEKYKSDGVDVIIAIATPAAAAAAPYASEIPLVFSAVEDPIASNFMDDLNKPNKNITGTSDQVQVDKIIECALSIYPDTKTIGYLYSTSEASSIANLKKLEAYASKHNLSIVKGGISTTADLKPVLNKLINESDIIFTPTDNTIAKAMGQVSAMCNEAKMPFFAGADSMVQDGAFAAYGINYETLGKESADMAIQIINKEAVSNIPVKIYRENLKLYLNKNTAEALQYDIEPLKTEYDTYVFE